MFEDQSKMWRILVRNLRESKIITDEQIKEMFKSALSNEWTEEQRSSFTDEYYRRYFGLIEEKN